MINKRFIAGAVCPRCAEMDKIFTYEGTEGEEKGKKYRACVRCDFQEELRESAPQQEIPTRVTPVPPKPAEEVQVLKFFSPKTKS